ncbi:hypothetical protein J6590_044159 [Homalodisca vitripennis]|nr:hypothetical protein J6590_044159 [Homalodisca vitripennis]
MPLPCSCRATAANRPHAADRPRERSDENGRGADLWVLLTSHRWRRVTKTCALKSPDITTTGGPATSARRRLAKLELLIEGLRVEGTRRSALALARSAIQYYMTVEIIYSSSIRRVIKRDTASRICHDGISCDGIILCQSDVILLGSPKPSQKSSNRVPCLRTEVVREVDVASPSHPAHGDPGTDVMFMSGGSNRQVLTNDLMNVNCAASTSDLYKNQQQIETTSKQLNSAKFMLCLPGDRLLCKNDYEIKDEEKTAGYSGGRVYKRSEQAASRARLLGRQYLSHPLKEEKTAGYSGGRVYKRSEQAASRARLLGRQYLSHPLKEEKTAGYSGGRVYKRSEQAASRARLLGRQYLSHPLKEEKTAGYSGGRVYKRSEQAASRARLLGRQYLSHPLKEDNV